VLWHCWLVGRKGIRPVKKNRVVGCWRGYLSGARCKLAYVQLMPLPLTVSCFSKIQIGFTFLVPAHLGSPGKRGVKWVCVSLCIIKANMVIMHVADYILRCSIYWNVLLLYAVFCYSSTLIFNYITLLKMPFILHTYLKTFQ